MLALDYAGHTNEAIAYDVTTQAGQFICSACHGKGSWS